MIRHRLTFIVALLLFMSGCDSSQPSIDDSLKFFGLTCANYQQVYNKPPANWEEFLKLSDAPGLEEDMKQLLLVRESDYTVMWNVDCLAADASQTVLAYSKTSDKPVLFADGSLRSVTSQEFDALTSAREGE